MEVVPEPASGGPDLPAGDPTSATRDRGNLEGDRSLTSSFEDHFSEGADAYARHRPVYPPALFAFLSSLCEEAELAWDCAAGSGQASVPLAGEFRRVVATDASARQVEQARPHPRVRYLVRPAGSSGLAARSVDLVTVAQALHWLPLEEFYAEVRRVAKPHGTIAAWCYGLPRLHPEVDAVIRNFYVAIVGPYWPEQRRHVERFYEDLPFPFEAVPCPEFTMQHPLSVEGLSGFLGTWSPVRAYRKEVGRDPIGAVRDDLRAAWPRGTKEIVARWPIRVRAGRVRGAGH